MMVIMSVMLTMATNAYAASLTYVSHTGTVTNPANATDGNTNTVASVSSGASMTFGGLIPGQNAEFYISSSAPGNATIVFHATDGTELGTYSIAYQINAAWTATMIPVNASTVTLTPPPTANISIWEARMVTPPPDTTAPSMPTGLTATPAVEQVELDWTANSEIDVEGYNVYQDGVKVNGTLISESAYIVTGLTAGVEYSFQVTAVDFSGNESTNSSTVTSTPDAPADTTAPAAPAGLTVTAGNKQALLSWDANPELDLSGYNVYVDGVKKNTSLITSESYTVTGLVNDQTYTFTVSAVDTSGNESTPSTGVTGTPESDLLNPPEGSTHPELNDIKNKVLTMSDEAKSYGIPIVIGAIAVGVIFVLALWLWMLSKGWIKKAKG